MDEISLFMFRLKTNAGVFITFIFLFIHQCEFVSAQNNRKKILFDANWKFKLGHATDPTKDLFYRVQNDFSKTKPKGINFSGVEYDDSSWQQIRLPHDWAVELPFSEKASCSHGYKEIGAGYPQSSIGWYRKTFYINEADSGKRFEIQFDGVFRDSHFWINGIYLGRNTSGYMGVRYDITDFVEYKKPNVIVVRADATQTEGWFYEGAGLYRHVWLNVFDNLHTSPEDVFIYTKSIVSNAEVITQVAVENEYPSPKMVHLEYEVLDTKMNVVVQAKSDIFCVMPNERKLVDKQITIEKPFLWDTDNPYRYTLVTKIVSEHKTVDEIYTRFGVRIFGYEPDGFYLNNRKVLIKGVCVHQDHAGVGTALLDEMQYYRVRLLKDMGANAYRTAHGPPTPELLDACDSLGMLVLDETRLLNSGSEYLMQFERLIKRDRNHACLFMWCIGNEEELIQNTSIGKRIALTLIAKQRELDPSRLSTYGSNVGNIFEGVNEVIPVRGFNYNLYGLDDYKKAYPHHPIIGTEVASTVSTRGVYLSGKEINNIGAFNGVFIADTIKAYLLDQDYSYPSWASRAEQWFRQTALENRFMGGFVWTGFDYRGEPTPFSWPNVNSHFGVMDICGFPKNVYYYYQSWWTDKEVLHLAPHWNIDIGRGKPVNVWVYSNADYVELFLNGKSLGKKDMPQLGHLNWTVNYVPGELQAVGYKNGKRISASVKTTSKPKRIILTPHKTTISADNQDAVVVNVMVVDRDGLEVPDANHLIHFKIRGAAEIMGVGNGDPSSHEKDRFKKGESVQRNLFNGKCQVIVRSGSRKSQIRLRAFSDGLTGASVKILQE